MRLYFFCDFTPWQSDFFFFRWYETLTLNCDPAFYRHVHLSWSQAHFPLYWTHRSITQAETPVLCSCEQKLIGPGMPQCYGNTCSSEKSIVRFEQYFILVEIFFFFGRIIDSYKRSLFSLHDFLYSCKEIILILDFGLFLLINNMSLLQHLLWCGIYADEHSLQKLDSFIHIRILYFKFSICLLIS